MYPKIKFSHFYNKIAICYDEARWSQPKTAKLLDVLPVKLENLSGQLLAYDTVFREDGKLDTYPLPKKGDYLLLIFIGDRGIFTTIRRATPEKEKYYKELIGLVFDLVIETKK